MRLVPEGQEDTLASKGTPLAINEAKATELLDKARELNDKPMYAHELAKLFEDYYTAQSIHYTSTQIAGVIQALYDELNPEPEVEPEAEPIVE